MILRIITGTKFFEDHKFGCLKFDLFEKSQIWIIWMDYFALKQILMYGGTPL